MILFLNSSLNIYISIRPISVFGIFFHDNNKNDTSLFVQKPYLRTKYIGSNIEEDIDLKNRYRIKNLRDPIRDTRSSLKKLR